MTPTMEIILQLVAFVVVGIVACLEARDIGRKQGERTAVEKLVDVPLSLAVNGSLMEDAKIQARRDDQGNMISLEIGGVDLQRAYLRSVKTFGGDEAVIGAALDILAEHALECHPEAFWRFGANPEALNVVMSDALPPPFYLALLVPPGEQGVELPTGIDDPGPWQLSDPLDRDHKQLAYRGFSIGGAVLYAANELERQRMNRERAKAESTRAGNIEEES